MGEEEVIETENSETTEDTETTEEPAPTEEEIQAAAAVQAERLRVLEEKRKKKKITRAWTSNAYKNIRSSIVTERNFPEAIIQLIRNQAVERNLDLNELNKLSPGLVQWLLSVHWAAIPNPNSVRADFWELYSEHTEEKNKTSQFYLTKEETESLVAIDAKLIENRIGRLCVDPGSSNNSSYRRMVYNLTDHFQVDNEGRFYKTHNNNGIKSKRLQHIEQAILTRWKNIFAEFPMFTQMSDPWGGSFPSLLEDLDRARAGGMTVEEAEIRFTPEYILSQMTLLCNRILDELYSKEPLELPTYDLEPVTKMDYNTQEEIDPDIILL